MGGGLVNSEYSDSSGTCFDFVGLVTGTCNFGTFSRFGFKDRIDSL